MPDHSDIKGGENGGPVSTDEYDDPADLPALKDPSRAGMCVRVCVCVRVFVCVCPYIYTRVCVLRVFASRLPYVAFFIIIPGVSRHSHAHLVPQNTHAHTHTYAQDAHITHTHTHTHTHTALNDASVELSQDPVRDLEQEAKKSNATLLRQISRTWSRVLPHTHTHTHIHAFTALNDASGELSQDPVRDLEQEATKSNATLRRQISRTWSRVLPGPSDPELRKVGLDNSSTFSFKDASFSVKVLIYIICMDI